MLSSAALVLRWQLSSCDKEVPTKPKIFTIWLFTLWNVGTQRASCRVAGAFLLNLDSARDKEEMLVMTFAGDTCCTCNRPSLVSRGVMHT